MLHRCWLCFPLTWPSTVIALEPRMTAFPPELQMGCGCLGATSNVTADWFFVSQSEETDTIPQTQPYMTAWCIPARSETRGLWNTQSRLKRKKVT